jgi:hypothetical protein
MLRLISVMLMFAAAVLAQGRIPVVVELFTSEGCSSCPPADRMLTQLEQGQPVAGVEVIALGEHVDYWDSLGWKDRFSSPLFSARQEEYGRLFRVDSVYTPQVVVNGQAQALGSDVGAVQQAIRAVSQGPRANVEISNAAVDRVKFKVNGLPSGVKSAEMLLAVTESGMASNVERGENKGRILTHTSVVRSLTNLGRLDAKNGAYTAEARLNLNPDWERRNVKLVLLVQDRTSLRIIGVAWLKL